MEEVPGGSRTNGAATERYLLGNFDLKGYGKSRLFVMQGVSPVIVVELDGLYVFLNGETEAETQEYYTQLLSLQGQSAK